MVSVLHASARAGRSALGAGLAGAFLTLQLFASPAAAGPMMLGAVGDMRCRLGAAEQAFLPVLPVAKKALQETGALTIVALGSSTTEGAGATAREKSYPAILQSELRRRLPSVEVNVINKGAGGQSAYDMVLRMDADVVELKPSVVIWQTVVNDAIRDIGEEKVAKILRKGIRKAQAAGIDMIMMDLQWLPRDGRYPQYDDYRAVLARITKEYGVSVFPRYAMMKNWSRSKQFTSEELVGMDGVHMVDATYRCLAIRLADGIVSALTGVKPELAAAPQTRN